MIKQFKRFRSTSLFIIFLSLILVLLVIFPLFNPYHLGTADGLAHKFRLVSFMKSLEEGNIRPRWLSDQALGFGSPIFLFNYLVPYYVMAGIKVLGFSIGTTVQIYQALSLALSFLFMFLLVKKLWGDLAGLVSATIFTWAPYHLLSVYIYEGWGEMTAFVFPPLILFLILNLEKRNFGLLTFSWFLFILSHNVSALMVSPVLILLGIVLSSFRVRATALIIVSFLTSVLLGSFFIIPAIFLNHLTNYPSLIAHELSIRAIYYKQIFSQYLIALATIKEMTAFYYDFTLGLSLLSLLIIFPGYIIVKLLFYRIKFNTIKRNILFVLSLFFFFILSLFLANFASDLIWVGLPIMKFIVYPFRFLFVATLVGSILAGYLAIKSKFVAWVLILLAVISGLPFTRPKIEIFPFDDSYFNQTQTIYHAPGTKKNMATIEFLPAEVDEDFLKDAENRYIYEKNLPAKYEFSDEVIILSQKLGVEKIEVEYETSKDSSLTVNTFYFTNWQAEVDGQRINIGKDKEGRMRLDVPAGRHQIKWRFGYIKTEKVANMISFFGIMILLGELLWLRRIYRKRG